MGATGFNLCEGLDEHQVLLSLGGTNPLLPYDADMGVGVYQLTMALKLLRCLAQLLSCEPRC